MTDKTAERLDGWSGTDGLSEDLNHRFSTAIMNFNAELSGCRTGALVQVGKEPNSRYPLFWRC